MFQLFEAATGHSHIPAPLEFQRRAPRPRLQAIRRQRQCAIVVTGGFVVSSHLQRRAPGLPDNQRPEGIELQGLLTGVEGLGEPALPSHDHRRHEQWHSKTRLPLDRPPALVQRTVKIQQAVIAEVCRCQRSFRIVLHQTDRAIESRLGFGHALGCVVPSVPVHIRVRDAQICVGLGVFRVQSHRLLEHLNRDLDILGIGIGIVDVLISPPVGMVSVHVFRGLRFDGAPFTLGKRDMELLGHFFSDVGLHFEDIFNQSVIPVGPHVGIVIDAD